MDRVQNIIINQRKMPIRFATPEDASFVAPLIFQAMEDIVYQLIGKNDKDLAISFLTTLFVQENNQYSYQNTVIYEDNGNVVGSLVFYDGARLEELRNPVLELAEKQFQQKITIENETQSGETYIDTLSVHPMTQGKGIGSLLIDFLMNYVDENQLPTIGLLVDENNPKAERLYTRLGFVYKNSQCLAGGNYKHLVFEKAE